jgi:hypothetical protein
MADELITDPIEKDEKGDVVKPNADSGNEPPKDVKQMTQAEIDAMVVNAKQQVKKKYADYDDIKKELDELRKIKEAKELDELNEVERAKKIAADKEAEAEAVRKELEDLRTAAKQERLMSAFEREAAKHNIPEKHLADAKLLAGITNDTEVESIAELVTKLVTDKPFLVEKKQQQAIGDPTNGQAQKPSEKSAQEMLKEAADKARKTGRMEDKIAYVELKAKLGL